MRAYLMALIRTYAGGIIIVLLALNLFLITGARVISITLIIAVITIATIRHWEAIRDFDFWAFDEWLRGRLNSLGIREWQAPYRAAARYCDPDVVKSRDEAANEMNFLMMELIKHRSDDIAERAIGVVSMADRRGKNVVTLSPETKSPGAYEAAQIRHDRCSAVLTRELVAQLASGELVAKGLFLEGGIIRSERVIPKSRWRILELDFANDEAHGGGLHYNGIVIGKMEI